MWNKIFGCSQSALSKSWYKEHGNIIKGKCKCRSWKIIKRQQRIFKVICREHKKCITPGKWAGDNNLLTTAVRIWVNEMGWRSYFSG